MSTTSDTAVQYGVQWLEPGEKRAYWVFLPGVSLSDTLEGAQESRAIMLDVTTALPEHVRLVAIHALPPDNGGAA